MVLSIHQPSYFPWLGLLHKIALSDVFILMDEVQLSDSGYQHRNLFMMLNGQPKFLTIPFVKNGYRQLPFHGLRIANDRWREDHLNFLRNNYRKHSFYGALMPQVENLLGRSYEFLFEPILGSMRLAMEWFGLDTRVIYQSELDYDRNLGRGDLVLALIRAAGADTYLSGKGAAAYLDPNVFGTDLTLRYDEFVHPTYPQSGAPQFLEGLASLDVVFNLGVDASRKLLRDQCAP